MNLEDWKLEAGFENWSFSLDTDMQAATSHVHSGDAREEATICETIA